MPHPLVMDRELSSSSTTRFQRRSFDALVRFQAVPAIRMQIPSELIPGRNETMPTLVTTPVAIPTHVLIQTLPNLAGATPQSSIGRGKVSVLVVTQETLSTITTGRLLRRWLPHHAIDLRKRRPPGDNAFTVTSHYWRMPVI